MAEGPGQPFNTGRLVLVFVGLSILVIGTWLVTRAPAGPEPRPGPGPVPMIKPEPPQPEQPLAFYLARGDALRGEAVFARCAGCHVIEAGAPHGVIAPNLYGVMGDTLASQPGFDNYSDALRERGGRWDWEATNAFLRSPRQFAPGTRMGFGGIEDPQQRADLMLFLNRQGGSLTPPTGAR